MSSIEEYRKMSEELSQEIIEMKNTLGILESEYGKLKNQCQQIKYETEEINKKIENFEVNQIVKTQ